MGKNLVSPTALVALAQLLSLSPSCGQRSTSHGSTMIVAEREREKSKERGGDKQQRHAPW